MELCTIETFHRKVRLGFGRYLAVCTASAIMFLISHPSALPAGPQAFSIKVITSLDDQFWTNSVIIEGTHEVMLGSYPKSAINVQPAAVAGRSSDKWLR